jgi:murein DD-endopeptidase MepM/ murein hydrolase activator NlpD
MLRLAACASLALATAACSSDSNRIEQPFSNPFTPHPTTTGSIGGQPQPQPQAGYVQSQPLPPAQPQYQPPRTSHAPATVPPAGYQPQASRPYQQPEVTGSVPRPAMAETPKSWDWNGGTPVTVGQGDTLDTISRRFGVPPIAVAEANGMTTGTPLYPGQRLVIPKYSSSGAQPVPPAPRQPQLATAPITTGTVRQPMRPAAGGQVHTVAPGETIFSIGRRYNVNPVALAEANRLPPHHKLRMGEQLAIPGNAARAQAQQTAPIVQRQTQVQAPAQAALQPSQRIAEAHAQPMPTARVITPAKDTPSPIEQAKEDKDEQVASNNAAGFRWPVRGRVIAGFGPKPTGQQNDGINIAVPEGTPVKASDDGVVAYSGNELKGYGNLVLVRHSNGHVTAYAHASELLVKRGESVKRGQVIAKSGQTGNVSSPQLHFEIRKGATPVDPMQFLTGAS